MVTASAVSGVDLSGVDLDFVQDSIQRNKQQLQGLTLNSFQPDNMPVLQQ